MRPSLTYVFLGIFAGLALFASAGANLVDGARDYCEIGQSADIGWWPPRYTCTAASSGGATQGVTYGQWSVLAAPAAVLILCLGAGVWILTLRWKPVLAWIAAMFAWAAFSLMAFRVAWAQAAEDFCLVRGSSSGPSDDLFPPTFSCEFLRADGSTFTRDFHSTPWVVVVGVAVLGLLGVMGFSLAAWRRVSPFGGRRQRGRPPRADRA